MNIVTLSVNQDEPCHGLFEGPVKGRWLQRVWVIRGDTIAKHETDMGPETDYEGVTPMAMPSFGENTVAELRAFADKNREDDYWQKRAEEMLAESTLIADHVRQVEIDWQVVRNRSVMGPYVTAQRNAYPQQHVERKLMERVRRIR